MIPENIKKQIDNMDYYQLLNLWRFSPVGDSRMIGEIGDYFYKVMIQKKDELGPERAVAISKAIGWEP